MLYTRLRRNLIKNAQSSEALFHSMLPNGELSALTLAHELNSVFHRRLLAPGPIGPASASSICHLRGEVWTNGNPHPGGLR